MTTKNVPVPQSQSMYAGATQKAVAPLQWAVDSAQGNTNGLDWVDAEIVARHRSFTMESDRRQRW